MYLLKRGGWPYSTPPNGSFTLNTQSPQARGLVAWWPMLGQHGNAATVRDYVADRYSMAQYNTPTWTTTEHGPALNYQSGSTQYLMTSQVPPPYPVTMTAWFRTTTVLGEGTLLAIADSGTADNYYRLQRYENTVEAHSRKANVRARTAEGTVVIGVWHLGVAVFASSSSRAVYIDSGGYVVETTDSSDTGFDNMSIGAVRDSSPGSYSDGEIGDVRLYNRALSDAEVWSLYDPATRWELYAPPARAWAGYKVPPAAPRGGRLIRTKRGGWPYGNPPNTQFRINTQSPQAQGLAAWWPTLGQQQRAGPLRDYVQNRYPMTQYNTPTWQMDGQLGQSLLFDDAASEYLSAGQAVVTAPPYTLSAWFRSDDATASQVLVGLVDSTVATHRSFLFAYGGGGIDPVAFAIQGGAGTVIVNTTTGYTAGKWHLATAIEYASTNRAVYIDAGEVGTDNTNVVPAGLNETSIGMLRDFTPSSPFSGQIADVRIYNRALSPAEIWSLYDPATRWELYAPAMPRGIVLAPAAGVTIPLFMHHYRQQRIGNGF